MKKITNVGTNHYSNRSNRIVRLIVRRMLQKVFKMVVIKLILLPEDSQ